MTYQDHPNQKSRHLTFKQPTLYDQYSISHGSAFSLPEVPAAYLQFRRFFIPDMDIPIMTFTHHSFCNKDIPINLLQPNIFPFKIFIALGAIQTLFYFRHKHAHNYFHFIALSIVNTFHPSISKTPCKNSVKCFT